MKNLKLGKFDPMSVLPQTTFSSIGALGVTLLTGVTMDHATQGNTSLVMASVIGTLAAFYLHGQHASRGTRDGYFFNAPRSKKKANHQKINWDATNHIKDAGIDAIVREERTAQYRILLINNKNPAEVKKQMSALSMILDHDEREMLFIQNYAKMTSAILIPFEDSEKWDKVRIDKSQLIPGKLMGYVGKDVKGNHVVYDRRHESHILVAGSTNAGKTKAIETDIASMRESGLNPEIYIYDPKGELKGQKADEHTSEITRAIVMLEMLAMKAVARMKKYTSAGCANYFEYQEKINADERPMMIYIDEATDLLKNKLKAEEDEDAWADRAYEVIFEISRLHRAAGLFLTLGMQHPKAEIIPTEIRNQFSGRLAFNVADATASRVILDENGAEKLPKFGAFLFKTSLKAGAPILGRGAIV